MPLFYIYRVILTVYIFDLPGVTFSTKGNWKINFFFFLQKQYYTTYANTVYYVGSYEVIKVLYILTIWSYKPNELTKP